MKKLRTSSRRSRASTSHQQTEPGADRSTAAAPLPPPTRAQLFSKRIEAIYTGVRSKPEDLYEPLLVASPLEHEIVGVIEDPIARELFSFTTELGTAVERVPHPHNSDQTEEYEKQVAELEAQAKIVLGLFRQQVAASNPEFEDEEGCLMVTSGWRVAKKRESIFGDMPGPFGIPLGFMLSKMMNRRREGEFREG